MQPQTNNDYQALLSDVIKKQIVILGPDITLAKARNVPGLVVADDGTVTQITGEPQAITQSLIDQFVQLSGLIVKKTMEPLLTYHATPDGVMQTPPAQTPSPVTQPVVSPIQTVNPPIETVQPASPTPPSSTPAASIPTIPPPTPTTVDNQSQNMQKIIDEALKQ